MYTDPSNIRDHVVKIRFNDLEADLVNAWVNFSGQQKAALLREMILEQAKLDMAAQFGQGVAGSEVPQMALFRTA